MEQLECKDFVQNFLRVHERAPDYSVNETSLCKLFKSMETNALPPNDTDPSIQEMNAFVRGVGSFDTKSVISEAIMTKKEMMASFPFSKTLEIRQGDRLATDITHLFASVGCDMITNIELGIELDDPLFNNPNTNVVRPQQNNIVGNDIDVEEIQRSFDIQREESLLKECNVVLYEKCATYGYRRVASFPFGREATRAQEQEEASVSRCPLDIFRKHLPDAKETPQHLKCKVLSWPNFLSAYDFDNRSLKLEIEFPKTAYSYLKEKLFKDGEKLLTVNYDTVMICNIQLRHILFNNNTPNTQEGNLPFDILVSLAPDIQGDETILRYHINHTRRYGNEYTFANSFRQDFPISYKKWRETLHEPFNVGKIFEKMLWHDNNSNTSDHKKKKEEIVEFLESIDTGEIPKGIHSQEERSEKTSEWEKFMENLNALVHVETRYGFKIYPHEKEDEEKQENDFLSRLKKLTDRLPFFVKENAILLVEKDSLYGRFVYRYFELFAFETPGYNRNNVILVDIPGAPERIYFHLFFIQF